MLNPNQQKSSQANIFQLKLKLSQLKFSGKLFQKISETMSYENQQLAFKHGQLKSSEKIHSTWFWDNAVNIKVTPDG